MSYLQRDAATTTAR